MKTKWIYIIISAVVLFSCGSDNDSSDAPVSSSDITKNITIDASTLYQEIQGFSASDCWTTNYVGKYWTTDAKEGITRLLFSREIKDGTPQGIGLSMWRFNLGGGTAEQGSASDFADASRRSECILQADGSLDWAHESGQQYFLQKAHEYGCNNIVLFSNTPPVYYTYNGKGYSNNGAYSNLKSEYYDDFALYMANVANHFQQEGIDVGYISPVNEPQYNWSATTQEGSGWQNSEIKKLTTELDAALTTKGLSTKILLAETGNWEYAYKEESDVNRSNVIYSFFDSASPNYVGNLKHVAQVIGGHSYWTDNNWSTLSTVRRLLTDKVNKYNMQVWQTEWSLLGDNYDEKDYPGHTAASYMDIALYMSKVIHADLTVANAASWSFWTAVDMMRWGHKNRFLLISIVPAGGVYGDITQSGTYSSTKTLWTLGNYSLFIRPGYHRIALNIDNGSDSFIGSAYLSPAKDKLVTVYTNLTKKNIAVSVHVKGLDKAPSSIKCYTTSEAKDLSEENLKNDQYTISPRSVVTFVYEFN
jgi:O-glycosyl hydrolase